MAKPPRTGERLHKYLAAMGIGSRRAIEGWIEQGKIKVDGHIAQLGERVYANSRITVNGRPLRAKPSGAPPRVILYNKPEGEISTRQDTRDRPTVFHRLPKIKGARWVAVGRLDINTRGLLLFTNDGALAHRLMHPSFRVEREYLCRVYGEVGEDALKQLRQGITSAGEFIRPQRVKQVKPPPQVCQDARASKNNWYSVVVNEGKYREIRRMWGAVGCRLSRLIRVRYGDILLPRELKPGQWQELKPAAVAALLRSGPSRCDDPPPAPAPDRGRPKLSPKRRSTKIAR